MNPFRTSHGLYFVAGAMLAIGILGAGTGSHVPSPAPANYGVGASAPPAPQSTSCGAPMLSLSLSPASLAAGQATVATVHIFPTSPSTCANNIYYEFTGPLVPGGQHYSQLPQFVIPTYSSTAPGGYAITVTAYLPAPMFNTTATAQATLQVVVA